MEQEKKMQELLKNSEVRDNLKTSVAKYSCQHCTKVFKGQQGLNGHMIKHKDKTSSKLEVEGMQSCKNCEQVFKR